MRNGSNDAIRYDSSVGKHFSSVLSHIFTARTHQFTLAQSERPFLLLCYCALAVILLALALSLCENISHPHLNFHLRSECVFDMRDARLFFSGFWLDLNRVDMPHTTSFFITFSRLLLLDLV